MGYPAFRALYTGKTAYAGLQAQATLTNSLFLTCGSGKAAEVFSCPELLAGFGLKLTPSVSGGFSTARRKIQFPLPAHNTRGCSSAKLRVWRRTGRLANGPNSFGGKVDVSRLPAGRQFGVRLFSTATPTQKTPHEFPQLVDVCARAPSTIPRKVVCPMGATVRSSIRTMGNGGRAFS